MKSILMSIQPKWCELIVIGQKTIEVRKTAPKEVPFKVYIYCTGVKNLNLTEYVELHSETGGAIDCWLGKVVAEFVVNKITYLGNVATDKWKYLMGDVHEYHKQLVREGACLSEEEMLKYRGKYGYHITALKIYDKPKELGEFRKLCVMSEMPYCQACKFGNIQYSSDEVECSRDIDGASGVWICENFVTRPPQNYIKIMEV